MSYLDGFLKLNPIEMSNYLSGQSYEDLMLIKKEVEIGYTELERRKNLILMGMDVEKIEDNVENNIVVNNLYTLMYKLEEAATMIEELRRQKLARM